MYVLFAETQYTASCRHGEAAVQEKYAWNRSRNWRMSELPPSYLLLTVDTSPLASSNWFCLKQPFVFCMTAALLEVWSIISSTRPRRWQVASSLARGDLLHLHVLLLMDNHDASAGPTCFQFYFQNHIHFHKKPGYYLPAHVYSQKFQFMNARRAVFYTFNNLLLIFLT